MTKELSIEEQLAQWAAEDAKLAAECKAEREYNDLIAELDGIAYRVNEDRRAAGNYDFFYLTDSIDDHESAVSGGRVEGTVEYWEACRFHAECAAGSRAEDAGLDINALIGRVIY